MLPYVLAQLLGPCWAAGPWWLLAAPARRLG
ncbi:hypothetical protein, partial [Hymenobacter coccineus]